MWTVKLMKTVSDFGLLKVNVTRTCKLSNTDECHDLEDQNMDIQDHENLKYYINLPKRLLKMKFHRIVFMKLVSMDYVYTQFKLEEFNILHNQYHVSIVLYTIYILL
jgi:hypothetical protein